MDRRDEQPWWTKALAVAGDTARLFAGKARERYVIPPEWWMDELVRAGLDRAPMRYNDIKTALPRIPDYSAQIERAFGPTRSQVAKRALGSAGRQVANRLPLATALMQTAELGGSTPQDKMRQRWYDKFKQREGVAGAPAKFDPGPFRPPWK